MPHGTLTLFGLAPGFEVNVQGQTVNFPFGIGLDFGGGCAPTDLTFDQTVE